MLTCIVCTKHLEGERNGMFARGTSRAKDPIKSLTSQIKEMVLKMSGSSRQGTPYFTSEAEVPRRRESGQDYDAVSEAGEELGGQRRMYRGGCSSSSTPGWDFASFDEVFVEEEVEAKEWVAQVEPGVHITFLSTPAGGNDLKRIRFSREMFNKWQAQRWWGENYDRILELYNVQRFSRSALPTPLRSDFEEDSPATPQPGRARTARVAHGGSILRPVPDPTEQVLMKFEKEALAQDPVEWVAQDQPGVFITIRQFPDGTRELRRVRFSRERFAEKNAKQWWEMNQERILAQYL